MAQKLVFGLTQKIFIRATSYFIHPWVYAFLTAWNWFHASGLIKGDVIVIYVFLSWVCHNDETLLFFVGIIIVTKIITSTIMNK